MRCSKYRFRTIRHCIRSACSTRRRTRSRSTAVTCHAAYRRFRSRAYRVSLTQAPSRRGLASRDPHRGLAPRHGDRRLEPIRRRLCHPRPGVAFGFRSRARPQRGRATPRSRSTVLRRFTKRRVPSAADRRTLAADITDRRRLARSRASERGCAAEAPERWRWIADEASLEIAVPRSRAASIHLSAWAFGENRRIAVVLDGTLLATIETTWRLEGHLVPLGALSKGFHTLRLRSLDGTGRTGPDARALSIAVYDVHVVEAGS